MIAIGLAVAWFVTGALVLGVNIRLGLFDDYSGRPEIGPSLGLCFTLIWPFVVVVDLAWLVGWCAIEVSKVFGWHR